MASGQTNITGGKKLFGTAQPSDVRMGMTYPDGKELRNGTLDLTHLTPDNIRSGVTIGGVVGVLEDISKLSGFLELFSQNGEGSFGIQAPEGATKALVIMAGGGGGGGGGGGSPNTSPSNPDLYFGCGGGGGGGGAGSFTWFIDKNRGAAGGDGGHGGHGGGGYPGHLIETDPGGSGDGGSIVVDTFDVKAGTYYYGAVGGGGSPGGGGFGGRGVSSNGSANINPDFPGGEGGSGGVYGMTPNHVHPSSVSVLARGKYGEQGHFGYRYGGGGSGGVYSGIGKKTKFKANNGGYRGSGAYSSFNSRGSNGYSGNKGQSGYIHILFFC